MNISRKQALEILNNIMAKNSSVENILQKAIEEVCASDCDMMSVEMLIETILEEVK